MGFGVYTNICQGYLLITTFSGQVSLEDIRLFASDIQKFVGEKGEVFVVVLMRMPGQHPQSIREFINIFQAVNPAMKRVCRFYTPAYNPLTSFLSNVISKAIGIHANLVQRHSLEELFHVIECDAERYPRLRVSLYNWETIKSRLLSYDSTGV